MGYIHEYIKGGKVQLDELFVRIEQSDHHLHYRVSLDGLFEYVVENVKVVLRDYRLVKADIRNGQVSDDDLCNQIL